MVASSAALRTVPSADPATPYSQAACWGDLVFTAGQVGSLDPLAPDLGTQARQALDALDAVLERAGASMGTVLRVEAFLADGADVDVWNALFRERFPSSPPARTTVVARFPLDGLLIELQAVAVAVARSAG